MVNKIPSLGIKPVDWDSDRDARIGDVLGCLARLLTRALVPRSGIRSRTSKVPNDYLLLVKRRPHTPSTISPALIIRHMLADSPNAAMPTKKLPVAPMPVQTA